MRDPDKTPSDHARRAVHHPAPWSGRISRRGSRLDRKSSDRRITRTSKSHFRAASVTVYPDQEVTYQGSTIRSQDVRRKEQGDEDLLACLEQLSGRRIRSRQDIAAYVDDLSRRAGVRHSRRLQLKNFLLAGLLLFAAFQYYFIDVQLQILAQPTLTVFYPTKDVKPQAGARI